MARSGAGGRWLASAGLALAPSGVVAAGVAAEERQDGVMPAGTQADGTFVEVAAGVGATAVLESAAAARVVRTGEVPD